VSTFVTPRYVMRLALATILVLRIFRFSMLVQKATPNPALNPVRFALWTLRDKAAPRRLALLQGLPQFRKCA